MPTSYHALALALAVAAPLAVTAPAVAAAVPSVTHAGAALSGAVVPPGGTIAVTAPAGSSVTFLLDGSYLGKDSTPPYTWTLDAAAGAHTLRVRVTDAAGVQTREDLAFTIGGPSAPAPQPRPVPAPSPVPTVPSGDLVVRTVEEVRAALATAAPGTVITVADGEYTFRPRLVASASGTAAAPIVLQGSRAAVLRSSSVSGDYGLHITGDHWRVRGLTVAHASKGIVLDSSVGTVLDGVAVHDIGDEGVHFRSCSSDGQLLNSWISGTGRRNPGFGEGVYVGSARSNWSAFSCTDGRDNSERTLIEGNLISDTAAEGADLKEGTESGTLRGNVFDGTGWSGRNSADSAVDVKGNGWVVEGNTVRGATGSALDAFSTHSVVSGYGTGNVFRGNTVEGPFPGWGFALFPAGGNRVSCDNAAPGAARGLANVPCT